VPTSPSFKYRGPDKRCPFPFNRDAATSPGLGYDYVALTASGGDAGLAEACRLWWLMEGVVVTPAGTCTWPIPSPGTGDLFATFDGWSASYSNYFDPNDRIHGDFSAYTGVLDLWMRTLTPSSITGGNDTDISIAYVGGEWRLYYRLIYFCIEETSVYQNYDNSLYQFRITNPESVGGLYQDLGTGSSTLWGYTLKWAAWAVSSNPAQTPSGCSVSDVGLTFTDETFYTLV